MLGLVLASCWRTKGEMEQQVLGVTSSANSPCACAASLGALSQLLTRYKTFYNEISRRPYKSKASYPAPRN